MRIPTALLLATPLFAGCASMVGPAPQDVLGGDFDRKGAYLGLYAIQSKEVFDTPTGVDVGDSDLGVGGKVGFRIIDRVAVEAVVENVDGFEVESGNVSADLELMQYGLNGKFFITTGRVQLYLLGGIGAASADVSGFNLDEDGHYYRGGLGVDIYLTSNFAAFGEANYNRMAGDTNDLDHIDAQFGVMFRF